MGINAPFKFLSSYSLLILFAFYLQLKIEYSKQIKFPKPTVVPTILINKITLHQQQLASLSVAVAYCFTREAAMDNVTTGRTFRTKQK